MGKLQGIEAIAIVIVIAIVGYYIYKNFKSLGAFATDFQNSLGGIIPALNNAGAGLGKDLSTLGSDIQTGLGNAGKAIQNEDTALVNTLTTKHVQPIIPSTNSVTNPLLSPSGQPDTSATPKTSADSGLPSTPSTPPPTVQVNINNQNNNQNNNSPVNTIQAGQFDPLTGVYIPTAPAVIPTVAQTTPQTSAIPLDPATVQSILDQATGNIPQPNPISAQNAVDQLTETTSTPIPKDSNPPTPNTPDSIAGVNINPPPSGIDAIVQNGISNLESLFKGIGIAIATPAPVTPTLEVPLVA